MLSNTKHHVNNFDLLPLGLVLNYHYLIKKVIKTGLFSQVYLVEDLSYHQDCLITVFIWDQVIHQDIVNQEIEEMLNSLDHDQRKQVQSIKYHKEFWCHSEKIFILQKTSEKHLPETLYKVLLPLTEYEVVQLLNQALLQLRAENHLLEDFQKLALTALILLNGQYLYDFTSKTWNWKQSKIISDQRKIVIQRMLGEDTPFSNIDEISQALNTIFLESSPETASHIPLSWYIAGSLGSLLILTGLIGIFRTQTPSPELSLSPTSSIIECPQSPNQVAIACDISVSDIDSLDFDTGKLTVKFQGDVTDEDRLVIFQPTGTNTNNDKIRLGDQVIGTFTGGVGKTPLEITLNTEANPSLIQSLIRNILYENVGDNPKKGQRKVNFQLTDGDGGQSNILTRVISINSINKIPQLTVPSSLSLPEDQQLIIKGISLEDQDAGNNRMTIQFQVYNGILKIRDNVPNGINWNEIYEEDIGKLQMVGTLQQINNTLKADQGIIYQSHPDFEGTDTLTITVNDGGHLVKENLGVIYPPSALEAQTNTQVVNIEILSLNDPPQLAQSIENEKIANNPLSSQNTADNQNLTKRTAVNLVESWLNAKADAYGSNYNFQILEQYTTGEYRRKSEGTRDWLIRNNAYYIYSGVTVEPASELTINRTEATIDIKLTENPTLYINGQIDPSKSRSSTGVYRWTLQFEEGRWKIANNRSL